MHNIEPFYLWRDDYTAETDSKSLFYKKRYSEFEFSKAIYNFYIHPQWDEFGSATLYLKILFADYEEGFAIIEFIGEWNDCLNNDIMFLKRDVIDRMLKNGINKFVLIGENVLNFHCSDDCYYEEWRQDVADDNGWIAAVNFRQHVLDEMNSIRLGNYLCCGETFNEINWRKYKPMQLLAFLEGKMTEQTER